jgi:hypothetical protein
MGRQTPNPIELWVAQMTPQQKLHVELYTKWLNLTRDLTVMPKDRTKFIDTYKIYTKTQEEVSNLLTERLGPYPPLPKKWQPFSMS